jgi:hypothetical protein
VVVLAAQVLLVCGLVPVKAHTQHPEQQVLAAQLVLVAQRQTEQQVLVVLAEQVLAQVVPQGYLLYHGFLCKGWLCNKSCTPRGWRTKIVLATDLVLE